MPQSTFSRSVWLPLITAGIMLLLALSLLVVYAWRNYDRQQPLVDLHRVETELQTLQTQVAALEGAPADNVLRAWQRELAALGTGELSPAARDGLARLEGRLAELSAGSASLTEFATTLDELAAAAGREQRQAAADLNSDALREVEIATTTLLLLPLVGLGLLLLFRHRILRPLRTVTGLLEALAHRSFMPAPEENLDPTIAPLVTNYNHLIARLEALEQDHLARRCTLESQVAAAARTLLEQQRSLSNAEKLAAIGEIAAGIAHELRNPLAGIQTAIANIREELDDADKIERLELVDEELRRVSRLLNELLSEAAHCPESPSLIDVIGTIRSLVALARYQLPEQVEIELLDDGTLSWSLPEQRLRQAMLNLILNSAHAIGDSPGRVTISIAQEGEALRIEVRDTGDGFPASMLEGGVRPFISHRADGTGLGLAMVHRFVCDAGGRLHLSNDVPRGSCVTMVLPGALNND